MPTNAARFDELENKLDKLLEMQKDTNILISSLVKRVDSLDHKMEVFTGEIHDHAGRLDNHQSSIKELEKKYNQALEFIDLLENRQREKNLRLLDVPEHSEKGTEMIPFLIKLLNEEWGLSLSEADVEKAHRLGAYKKNARHARGIIFRVQNIQTKHKILQAVKVRRTQNASTEEDASAEEERRKYRIVPDISVQMRKRRDAFWPLRERLHKLNITTRVKYPAVLVVQEGEDILTFSTLQEAEEQLHTRFPSIGRE